MKKKLGEILVAAGAVSSADIDLALIDQSAGEPARLGDLLVALGKITPLQLARALCEQYGLPFTEVPPVASAVLESVPLDIQRQFRFVPIDVQPGAISIAMADPSVALRDVLPVLKRRFSSVKIYVAAGDEVDSVHSTLSGDYGAPSVALPHVAPSIAPVRSMPSPAPTADELFGSLDLDTPGPFELEAPPAAAGRPHQEEEEPYFFEATLQPLPEAPPRIAAQPRAPDPEEEPALELPPLSSSPSFPELTIEEPVSSAELEANDTALTEVSSGELPPFELPDAMPDFAFDAPPPMTEVPWDAAATVAAEPVAADALAETAAFFDSQFSSTLSAELPSEPEPETVLDDAGEAYSSELEVVDLGADEPELPTPALEADGSSVEVSLDEDTPFFDAPEAGPSVQVMADEDFVDGVPASSPSSLAPLEIEPGAPMIAMVPPITLPLEQPRYEAPPAEGGALPDWLSADAASVAPAEPVGDGWSPELESLAPSRLIVAVAKALLKRGVLSKADLLEALEPRK